MAEKPLDNDISVLLMSNPGKNNLGTYKITVAKDKKNEAVYIAKLCIKNDEPETYRKLQDKVELFNSLSKNQNYPAFAKFVGTFTLPRHLIEKHFQETTRREKELRSALKRAPNQDVNVLLLEAAKGEPLKTLINNVFTTPLQEIQRIFETIGESIGNFMSYGSQVVDDYQSPLVPTPSRHLIGFLHRDLNSDNVFYDRNTNKVTLIDYDSLTDKGEVDVALQGEMDSMFYELIPVIEKCQNKEQAAQVKAIVDSYQKGIESAFKDSPKKLAIVKYYMTFFRDMPDYRLYGLLKKYFNDDELPNFEQIKEDYQRAINN